jgi:hypothetical protein
MSTIFKPRSEASHWYYPDGSPCHQFPYADKKRAGEMRNTTLADARKLGLVPSVTNLLNVISNPALQQWKLQQLLLAAMTLPRQNGESEEDYVERVIKDSEAYTAKTAEFGHRIHDAIDTYLSNGERPQEMDILPQLEPTFEWIENNVTDIFGTEFVISGNGFAGRLDLHAKVKGIGKVIIDFKTRTPYKGQLTARKSDLWQLCGYRLGLGETMTSVASLIINRDNAMDPLFKVWDADEINAGTQVFKHARAIWHINNGIDLDTSTDAY